MKFSNLLMSGLMLCIATGAQAQTSTATGSNSSKPTYKLYGFVRNYFYYDSRKNLQSSGGLFNQIPMDEDLDVNGSDLNDVPSARLLAITTRLGLDFKGPELLGAQSSAKIETDFNGFSGSTTMLRIRHAYFSLNWGNQDVLMGQTWHPMTKSAMPDVLGLATGSPFNPFSRTPQLRYDYRTGSLQFTGALLYQLQYTSVGPNGASVDYSKNNILPELFAGVEYRNDNMTIGAGIDYLQIKPRTEAYSDYFRGDIKVDEKVSGVSPFAYFTYKSGLFSLKGKTILAQNTAHLNMMSGYGISEINYDGSYDYTPLKSTASWINAVYGKDVQVGVFGGYIKNLGTVDDLAFSRDQSRADLLYVRGYKNIDRIYRFSPSIVYNQKNFSAGLEYELTTVSYGRGITENAQTTDAHNVSNNRICIMVKYSF